MCGGQRQRYMNFLHTVFYTILVFMAAWFSFQVFTGDSFDGKVVTVIDGDTIDVMHDNKVERVRLGQIDAPEKSQPFGKASKRYLLSVASNQVVKVKVDTVDRYGRTVGEVFLPGGISLNKQIVKNGYAWEYKRYSKGDVYSDLESMAKSNKSGLWQDENPVPPWEWRGNRHQKLNSKVSSNAKPSAEDFTCGSKQYCREMTSCEEAVFYMNECSLNRLDGNENGVPCEILCL